MALNRKYIRTVFFKIEFYIGLHSQIFYYDDVEM